MLTSVLRTVCGRFLVGMMSETRGSRRGDCEFMFATGEYYQRCVDQEPVQVIDRDCIATPTLRAFVGEDSFNGKSVIEASGQSGIHLHPRSRQAYFKPHFFSRESVPRASAQNLVATRTRGQFAVRRRQLQMARLDLRAGSALPVLASY